MNLQHVFYRLPFRFEAERLRHEIEALGSEAWNWNYRDLKGTSTLPLISADDRSEAVLRWEACLERLPYLAQVLAAFGIPLGRACLVRLEQGAGYPPQADSGAYWQNRVQVHVPILTNPNVRFFCARQPVFMAPGEAWTFSNALMHRFINDSASPCIHLVIDLPGSAVLDLARPLGVPVSERPVPYQKDLMPELALETVTPAAAQAVPRFEKPVFVVAAPRSGSTLLFETLAAGDGLWTLGGEGGAQLETIASLAPQSLGVDSNRLTAQAFTASVGARLVANYAADLRDAGQKPWRTAPQTVRFLEKTPKNALRIPFLKAAFPDAKFIFLHREAKANISAVIDAWRSGKFVTYTNLPDWQGSSWSLLLIPGWRELIGAGLGEVAMRQWRDTNQIILDDLATLPAEDWCSVRYEDLVRDPAAAIARLCAFADVEFGERLRSATAGPLKLSRYTLTAPEPEKWRRNESLFAPHLSKAQALIDRLSSLSP